MKRWLDNATLRRVVALLLLLGLWETASRLKWLDPFYVPAPSAIGKVLFSLFADGQIWTHLEATFSAAIIGLIAGALILIPSLRYLFRTFAGRAAERQAAAHE